MQFDWETWSLTLTEERRLRIFENIILMRIFGSFRILTGYSTEKRPLERSKYRWEGNITRRMDRRVLVNATLNLRVT